MDQKKLVVSILQFLTGSLPSLSSDSAESLQVSIDCIRDAFGVNESDPTLQSSATLPQIFNAFSSSAAAAATSSPTAAQPTRPLEELFAQSSQEIPDELRQSFSNYLDILRQKGAFNDPSQHENILRVSKQKFVESKATEIKEIAEKLKVEGNNKLTALDFNGAVECYTKAILYDGTNAVYYANRASAYSNLKQYDNAVEDANNAISRNPSYSKAYFRLGSAKISQGKAAEAVEAFKKALEFEPNNEVYKSSLANAEAKLNSPMAGMPAGMPDLGGMDLGSLLSNPMVKNMAQSFMQDPQMRQMMENGNLQDMARNVMSNPEMMSMFGGLLGKK
ncbi:hypothetical protein SAMD00019534_060930 [Acytostelium subglobosum LB1]|uniref:hypothetical protein n=1 Tax=Acytostelium subglobosum LB1 TaxID=1410327 RepID=UPI000644BABD|nr:hypothetical protein SAMD00019534_060930 [Acytostelium subglobosum LB1]GAM22918.1 hypothetical protein SAMD00019534_060930 [Acytostelium subglobosum LB1]|eukprot:XP_012754145.1 hypothetical protein SAMD00019534_060930 [Acytostelium subglobosum LB1]